MIKESNRQAYEFDSFIVSDSNREAYNACISVIGEPTGRFISLHGPSSCGKTHLLTATRNAVERAYPHKSILMVSFDDVISEYLESLELDSGAGFYENLCKYDLLIIDNLQFAAGKISTLLEMAAWFSMMLSKDKCVMIALDKPTDEISELLDEMKKCHGDKTAVIEIEAPDIALREKYLERLLLRLSVSLDSGVQKRIIDMEHLPLSSFGGLVSRIHYINAQADCVDREQEIDLCFEDYCEFDIGDIYGYELEELIRLYMDDRLELAAISDYCNLMEINEESKAQLAECIADFDLEELYRVMLDGFDELLGEDEKKHYRDRFFEKFGYSLDDDI